MFIMLTSKQYKKRSFICVNPRKKSWQSVLPRPTRAPRRPPCPVPTLCAASGSGVACPPFPRPQPLPGWNLKSWTQTEKEISNLSKCIGFLCCLQNVRLLLLYTSLKTSFTPTHISKRYIYSHFVDLPGYISVPVRYKFIDPPWWLKKAHQEGPRGLRIPVTLMDARHLICSHQKSSFTGRIPHILGNLVINDS